MNAKEIQKTEGGIIPFLIYGAAVFVEVVLYGLAADIILNFNTYSEDLESAMNNCECN